MNRADLMTLLGHRVTITNPRTGSSWTGTLAALGDEPCAVIDEDDGTRFCIPQSFTITPAAEPEPAPKPSAQWERLAIREPNGDITYTWPNVPPTADVAVGARVHGILDRQLDRLAETLFNSIDRLEQHIEQRAQELAQPLIYDAREAAATEVKIAQYERQRAEDLVAELRRHIAALEQRRDEQRQRAERAEAAVERMRELIDSYPPGSDFVQCGAAQLFRDHLDGTKGQKEDDRG